MSHKGVAVARDHSNEVRRLSTLLEISQALSDVLNLKAALHAVLEILERQHRVVCSSVTRLDEETSEIYVAASCGPGAPGPRVRARPGDGITGRVVETGKAIVVPQVSREPSVLHTLDGMKPGRQELTFIGVPVIDSRRTVGALGVTLPFNSDRDYDRSLKFYRLVGSMVAHAIRTSKLVDADRRRLVEENAHLRDELQERYAFRHIIGNSAAIQQVYEQVVQVSRTNTTVLIRGESGTGKEMIAHAIHYNSPRAKKPFIKVSCAALPESLIESELFGYERGAFTGAQGTKRDASSSRRAGRSSSTKSETSTSPPRSSCCGCCRSGRSSVSEARSRSGSTFVSSRPRIALSKI